MQQGLLMVVVWTRQFSQQWTWQQGQFSQQCTQQRGQVETVAHHRHPAPVQAGVATAAPAIGLAPDSPYKMPICRLGPIRTNLQRTQI